MDEPLGALDKKLRDQMQLEIKALQRAPRHHRPLCHARPGRGAGDVRSHLPDEPGADRADRHARGALFPAAHACSPPTSSATRTSSPGASSRPAPARGRRSGRAARARRRPTRRSRTGAGHGGHPAGEPAHPRSPARPPRATPRAALDECRLRRRLRAGIFVRLADGTVLSRPRQLTDGRAAAPARPATRRARSAGRPRPRVLLAAQGRPRSSAAPRPRRGRRSSRAGYVGVWSALLAVPADLAASSIPSSICCG